MTRSHDVLLVLIMLAVAYLSQRAPLWPAIALMGTGETLQLWAAANLQKLVIVAETGPYACMRHPMYVGRFILGLGMAMLLDARWIVVVPYIIVYCFYAQARALREEARLTQSLGEPYVDYCRRVPRWLPRRPANPRRIVSWCWTNVWRNRQHHATLAALALCLLVVLRRRFL